MTLRRTEFKVIAFDADDTLWRNEDIFIHAQDEFINLLLPYHDEIYIRSHLGDVQIQNLEHFGYGIKGIMWLAITLAVYDTISLAAIPSPCNPGSTSVVPSSTKIPANVAKVHAKSDIQVKFYEEFIVADQLFYQTPCCCY